MKLEEVILRGTRAAQPAFGTLPVGTLYFVTDESVTEYNTGAAWVTFSDVSALPAYIKKKIVTLFVDGGGVAITTGIKGYIRFPWTGTITKVTMLADVSGSAVVDIWKDTYANYPPTVADTITAAAKPTISAALKSEDSTLTGWTTAVTAGDVFGFNVDSAATITKLTLELEVTVSA